MHPESMQVDFEWASDPERGYGGFDFGDRYLVIGECGAGSAARQLALELAEFPVQPVDAARPEPVIEPRGEADDWDQRGGDRDDEEHEAIEQRGQPEGGVLLPEGRARAVEALRGG